jgi:hypothetical protein
MVAHEKYDKTQEPSADQDKEPSADQDKEPSADQDKEPSADQDKEPSADQDQENELMNIDWIEEYEDEEKYYTMFYPEKTNEIKVNMLYVNKTNELEKIREKMIYLERENEIKKEDLIKLITENNRIDKVKYKLISIMIYNVTLTHPEMKHFLISPDKYDFITSLRNIEDCQLQPSVSCLQELNNVYILFTEEDTEGKKLVANTKRVKFNLLQNKTRRRKT